MKAVVYEKYGSPDVLQLKEVATPTPKDDEVLVAVRAASVNAWDWDWLRGKPAVFRVWSGLLKPTCKILGADVAGRVAAVGHNVTRWRVGDAVFGDLATCGWGSFAEYACAPENMLARKSDKMTFVQAAAVPQAGLLALQSLRKRPITPGDAVLINGGGGGVGTFAIQISKSFGAKVTGVDDGLKLATMRAAGADRVIDYTREDYTRNGERYDLILDVVARRSMVDYARALTATGRFVMVGGAVPTMLAVGLVGPMVSRFRDKKLGVLAWHPNRADLDAMTALVEAGKVTPVVDRTYPLGEVADALRYLGGGHAKGKVVVTVGRSVGGVGEPAAGGGVGGE